ncbi:MAG: ATP-binding protein [Elusimicrobiales bacterium]
MKNVYVKTANVAAFAGAMNRLKDRASGVPGMALAYGEPGLGKSRAAVWWTAANEDAVYIRAKAVMTPRWLLEELAAELGEEPARRASELFRQCQANLKERPRMVLVDEVDFLVRDPRLIETLRDLHDSSGAPIVMLGMNGAEKKLARYKHICDRFSEIVHFRELSLADVRLIAEQLCEVKLSVDAVDYLHVQARRFRQVVMALYRAEHIARANSLKEVTAAHLGGAK